MFVQVCVNQRTFVYLCASLALLFASGNKMVNGGRALFSINVSCVCFSSVDEWC